MFIESIFFFYISKTLFSKTFSFVFKQNMAFECVQQGKRSSLLYDRVGDVLKRKYHDTGNETILPVNLNESGRRIIAGNLLLDSVLSREGHCVRRVTYRGLENNAAPALYLQRATTMLLDFDCRSIRSLAQLCGITENTAWSYVCKIAEVNRDVAAHAQTYFVYPRLMKAIHEVDVTGALKDVMQRLNAGPLQGDVEWRCLTNRCAHLRLARICLTCA